jgi:putative NADH-flavin reductase
MWQYMLCHMVFPGRKALKTVAVIISALLLVACASQGRQPDRRPPSPPIVDQDGVATGDITIALLGATGMVGGFVLREALARGYQVRALARTPQKLDPFKDRISIVKGDARDVSTIAALLRGSDVVISALGPVKADGDAARMISTTATGYIIGLMPEYDIRRYIVVSGGAVELPGDDRNLTGWLMQKMAAITLHDTLRDKQAEYQLLADSPVQWTLVRCPLIAAEPFESYPRASLDTPTSFNLRAGELAHFLLDQIHSQEFVGKGPFLESQ